MGVLFWYCDTFGYNPVMKTLKKRAGAPPGPDLRGILISKACPDRIAGPGITGVLV